jgi:hypothetical protein
MNNGTRDPIEGQPTDQALAAVMRPLLHELLERLMVRGESSQAASVARLLSYVVSDFGNPKALPGPVDTATRPMFDDVHHVGGTKQ